MVILLLPLVQEGLLSVTSESMCMKYRLTALVKIAWLGELTIAVDWDVKPQIKHTQKNTF